MTRYIFTLFYSVYICDFYYLSRLQCRSTRLLFLRSPLYTNTNLYLFTSKLSIKNLFIIGIMGLLNQKNRYTYKYQRKLLLPLLSHLYAYRSYIVKFYYKDCISYKSLLQLYHFKLFAESSVLYQSLFLDRFNNCFPLSNLFFFCLDNGFAIIALSFHTFWSCTGVVVTSCYTGFDGNGI